MITHKINDFTIGFIEVNTYEPNSFDIDNSDIERPIFSVIGVDGVPSFQILPKGNWQIFSTDSREVTEEQAREVMPKAGLENDKFKSFKEHFTNPYFFYCDTAIESYNSMKVMLSVVDVNPIPEPEFQGGLCGEDNQGGYDPKWVADFEQAQSQVKRYVVVIKKD